MRIFKSLLASYYAVSNCKVSKKCWDIRFHDFGPNQAQIAYLPKKDIFGGIPFKIFDIAICLIIIKSLQKSWEWIPRTKQVSFLGPSWGKNGPFCNNKFFFKNWAASLFSKHNDVIVCKISKKILKKILRVYHEKSNLQGYQ